MIDFMLLFGDSIDIWNVDNFGWVIEWILREGNIGYVVLNSELERCLIENVWVNLVENIDNMIYIKMVFNFL